MKNLTIQIRTRHELLTFPHVVPLLCGGRDEVREEGGPPGRDGGRRRRRRRGGRLGRGHLSQEAVPLGLVDEAALAQNPQHRLKILLNSNFRLVGCVNFASDLRLLLPFG